MHGAGFLVIAWLMATSDLWPAAAPVPAPPEKIEITVPVSSIEVVPAAPVNDRVIKTDGLTASEVAPKNPRYESDRTTTAGSAEAAEADGQNTLPGQAGLDIPHLAFEEKSVNQPKAALDLREPENFATSAQTPPTAAAPAPEKKKPTADPLAEAKTRIKSRIEPNQAAGVDAIETARGRYLNTINRQLQVFWNRTKSQHKDVFTYGTVTLEIWVREDGTIENASVIDRYGGTAQMEITMLKEVQKLNFPPIPADLSATLKNKRLRHLPKFTLY
jgi:outer membrane biosynthesis protein TonB